MDAQKQMAGLYGTKIITGAGPHLVNTRFLICRVQDSVIVGFTLNGDEITTGKTTWMPSGTKLNLNEQVHFAETEVVTSITLTNDTDSLTVVTCP